MFLISPLCQAFKEKFFSETEKVSGLTLIDGAPMSVVKGQEEGHLILHYAENGQEKKETFDMIVVLTKPKIAPEILALSKRLEIEVL